MRDSTQPVGAGENALHTPQPGEVYVDTLVVTQAARGKGVGTQLLEWAEEIARGRPFEVHRMVLGVVRGNPALRLYQRQGYRPVATQWCLPSCLLGCPNGAFGAVLLEKRLAGEEV